MAATSCVCLCVCVLGVVGWRNQNPLLSFVTRGVFYVTGIKVACEACWGVISLGFAAAAYKLECEESAMFGWRSLYTAEPEVMVKWEKGRARDWEMKRHKDQMLNLNYKEETLLFLGFTLNLLKVFLGIFHHFVWAKALSGDSIDVYNKQN